MNGIFIMVCIFIAFIIFLIVIFTVQYTDLIFYNPSKIIIIPNAENDNNNLSTQGINRSNLLPDFLSSNNIKSAYTCYPGNNGQYSYISQTLRGIVTFPVYSNFSPSCIRKMLSSLYSNTNNKNNTVLICWKKECIQSLLRMILSDFKIKVDSIPSYLSTDYASYYVIDITNKKLENGCENLIIGDQLQCLLKKDYSPQKCF